MIIQNAYEPNEFWKIAKNKQLFFENKHIFFLDTHRNEKTYFSVHNKFKHFSIGVIIKIVCLYI